MAADDFEGFLADRRTALLSHISSAMGKVISDDEWGDQEPSLDVLDDTEDL
jgi:hypothetical protein